MRYNRDMGVDSRFDSLLQVIGKKARNRESRSTRAGRERICRRGRRDGYRSIQAVKVGDITGMYVYKGGVLLLAYSFDRVLESNLYFAVPTTSMPKVVVYGSTALRLGQRGYDNKTRQFTAISSLNRYVLGQAE